MVKNYCVTFSEDFPMKPYFWTKNVTECLALH